MDSYFSELEPEVFADTGSSENFAETSSSEHFADESDSSGHVSESQSYSAFKTKSSSKLFEKPSDNKLLEHLNPVENICKKHCTNGCSEYVSNMKAVDKTELKEQFKSSKKVDIKNKLLEHLKYQKLMGLDTCSFIFRSQSFCLPAFCHATTTSPYLAKKVIKDFQNGFKQYIHGSAAVPRESHARVNFISWMICFSEIHGQSDPEKVTTVLPAFLSKSELFKIYRSEATEPLVKPSTFYFLMKKCFGVNRSDTTLPNIRISKYSSHSKASHYILSVIIFGNYYLVPI